MNFRKEIEVASSAENLHLVEQQIESLREELEFRDDAFGNVMIATTEAVNNGIVHGNKENPGKLVKVLFQGLSPYRILVRVEDEGSGFDPNNLKDPTAPENLENPGGRGVFLMKNLSDDLRFLDNGRVVEMEFNI